MLQAKSNNGKMITLASLTKQEITIARQGDFFCPACKEPVLVKAGAKTIPHFAHWSKSECVANDYGEGPYHEQGKLLLYQWLQHQGIDVELEKYLPEISQRPDLFVSLNHRKIAFEYQCARISIEVLTSRNAGYKQVGITPIWILGANHFKRIGRQHFKLDQFILSFMHRFSAGLPATLYFFCPHTLQFVIIQHIQLTTARQAIGQFQFIPLRNMTFLHLFTKGETDERSLYQQWNKEKKDFRLRPSNRLYGSELSWHKWLYQKGTHKEQLPSTIYLPVSGQYLMTTPLWNWQSRLCLDVIAPLPIGGNFSLHRCQDLFRQQIQAFTLLNVMDDPINQYLQLLTRLQIIEETGTSHFIKRKDIRFHKNIEDSMRSDTHLMNLLIHCSTMGSV